MDSLGHGNQTLCSMREAKRSVKQGAHSRAVGTPMIYSVWNWHTSLYDYYNGPGPAPGDPLPVPRGFSGKTVSVESVLPVLPPSSTPAGSGAQAKGRVAVKSSAEGVYSAVGLGETEQETKAIQSVYTTIGLGIVGVWIWRKIVFP